MNFSAPNLSDLEPLITTLFASNKCACHIINPHKTRILMWKETKDDQITYHLRIGIQKFLSQEQVDRNGETYWRFGDYAQELKKEEKSPVQTWSKEAISQELDPITKFQQRQAQTQQLNNHGEPDNPVEPAVNNSQSS